MERGLGFEEEEAMRAAAAAAAAPSRSSLFAEEEEEEEEEEKKEEEGVVVKYPIEKASMPFMITRDMRRTLIEDMNYSRKEVRKPKPSLPPTYPPSHLLFFPQQKAHLSTTHPPYPIGRFAEARASRCHHSGGDRQASQDASGQPFSAHGWAGAGPRGGGEEEGGDGGCD